MVADYGAAGDYDTVDDDGDDNIEGNVDDDDDDNCDLWTMLFCGQKQKLRNHYSREQPEHPVSASDVHQDKESVSYGDDYEYDYGDDDDYEDDLHLQSAEEFSQREFEARSSHIGTQTSPGSWRIMLIRRTLRSGIHFSAKVGRNRKWSIGVRKGENDLF